MWNNPDFWNCLPFVGLATAKAGEHVQRPLTTRVIEGIIMGVAGGALGAYVSLQVLQSDFRSFKETMRNSVQEIKGDISRLEGLHIKQ